MEAIKVKYNSNYLLRMFKDFSSEELKETINDFNKNKNLNADDKIFRNMMEAELQRREIK